MMRLIGFRSAIFAAVVIPHLLVLESQGPWLWLGVVCGVMAVLEEKYRTSVLMMLLAVELAMVALLVPEVGTFAEYAVPVVAGVCLVTVLALLHWSQAYRRDAAVEPGVIADEASVLVLVMGVAVVAAGLIWLAARVVWPWFTVPLAAIVFSFALLVALDALRVKPPAEVEAS